MIAVEEQVDEELSAGRRVLDRRQMEWWEREETERCPSCNRVRRAPDEPVCGACGTF